MSLPCDDFSEFKRALQELRVVDDKIVYELNLAVPTATFSGNTNTRAQCQLLWDQLISAHQQREIGLSNCISRVSANVTSLKGAEDSTADHRSEQGKGKTDVSGADYRQEQSKLRLMKMELTAEEILRERTLKVFKEKCQRFYNPRK